MYQNQSDTSSKISNNKNELFHIGKIIKIKLKYHIIAECEYGVKTQSVCNKSRWLTAMVCSVREICSQVPLWTTYTWYVIEIKIMTQEYDMHFRFVYLQPKFEIN